MLDLGRELHLEGGSDGVGEAAAVTIGGGGGGGPLVRQSRGTLLVELLKRR